jgi:phospholipid/cholesterol/gamma-HCH transport system substrate-binding protein
MKFTRRERIVGLFMVGVALLLLATVFLVGRGKDWFKTYVTYYAVFNESYNLNVNAAVKLSKADIGKVRDISLTEDKVRVELAILKEYSHRIKEDSVATVESPTLIGSEYVSIKAGSPKSPQLKAGSEIHSEPKKSLDDYMAEFQIQETAKKFVKAVQNLSDLTDQLSSRSGPLHRTLASAQGFMGNLEAVSKDVRDGKGSVGHILKSDELVKNIQAEIKRLDSILAGLEKQTPAVMDDVRASVQSLKKILASIEADTPEVMGSTKKGINEIRQEIKSIDSVVQSVQKAPIIRSNIPPAPRGESTDAGLRK